LVEAYRVAQHPQFIAAMGKFGTHLDVLYEWIVQRGG
jgi:hypothetical protein